MIVTPGEVVPFVESLVAPISTALRVGMEFADDVQPGRLPDPDAEPGKAPEPLDRHFWSHCARYRARKYLINCEKRGWTINPSVPNSGIHLGFDAVHKIRVLRAFGETPPPAGPNRKRRIEWSQGQIGLPLGLATKLSALNLIIDWQDVGYLPKLHLSLPKSPGDFYTDPEVYWRVPITGNADDDLATLAFVPGDEPDGLEVTLRVDPAEEGTE